MATIKFMKPGEYNFDPKSISLDGEGKHDPLFDKRGEEKPDVQLVADYAEGRFIGVTGWLIERENISDEANPTYLQIVAGRRRTIAAIAAGQEHAKYIVLAPDTKEFEQIALMIKENELRKEDTPVNRANKASKFIQSYCEQYRPASGEGAATTIDDESGEIIYNGAAWQATKQQTIEARRECAKAFGVTEKRIRQLLELLLLSRKVQSALESGKVSDELAREWKDLSHDKQDEKLEKALVKAQVAGKESAGKGNASDEPKFIGAKKVNKLLEAHENQLVTIPKDAIIALNYIMGLYGSEESARGSIGWLDRYYRALEKEIVVDDDDSDDSDDSE